MTDPERSHGGDSATSPLTISQGAGSLEKAVRPCSFCKMIFIRASHADFTGLAGGLWVACRHAMQQEPRIARRLSVPSPKSLGVRVQFHPLVQSVGRHMDQPASGICLSKLEQLCLPHRQRFFIFGDHDWIATTNIEESVDGLQVVLKPPLVVDKRCFSNENHNSQPPDRVTHIPDTTNGTAIGLPISWGGFGGSIDRQLCGYHTLHGDIID